jgi:hypothetical protein
LQLLMLLKKFQKVSKRFKKNEDGDDWNDAKYMFQNEQMSRKLILHG